MAMPLGSGASVMQASEQDACLLRLAFGEDGRRCVATLRAASVEEAESWLASLEVLGGVRRVGAWPGFAQDPEDALGKLDQLSTTAVSESLAGELAAQSPAPPLPAPPLPVQQPQPQQQAQQQPQQPQQQEKEPALAAADKSESKDEEQLVAAVHDVRRCCGYLFVLTPIVSAKWRETFCVFAGAHLLEFASPGDAAPLFVWDLRASHPPQLRRSPASRAKALQVLLRGRLRRLEDDENTVNLECVDSRDLGAMQLCAHTDAETLAWALSLPELLGPNALPRFPRAPGGGRDLSASALARECARFAVRAFYPLSRVSTAAAADAGRALTLTAGAGMLREGRVRASASPATFQVQSLLPLGEEEERSLRRGLSIQLRRLTGDERGASPRAARLRLVGLRMVTPGELGGQEAPEHGVAALGAGVECRQTGRFRLFVMLRGHHVFGSPFRVEVLPGSVSAPHCTMSAPVRRGDLLEVVVTRRDALLNECSEGRAWKEPFSAEVVDDDPGGPGIVKILQPRLQACTVRFAVADPHRARLVVRLGGEHVRGSPMRLSGVPLGSPAAAQTAASATAAFTVAQGALAASLASIRHLLDLPAPAKLYEGAAAAASQGPPPAGPTPAEVEQLVSPLREVARIEQRGGLLVAAPWKRLLCSPSWDPAPGGRRRPAAQLRILAAAVAASDLPQRGPLATQLRHAAATAASLAAEGD